MKRVNKERSRFNDHLLTRQQEIQIEKETKESLRKGDSFKSREEAEEIEKKEKKKKEQVYSYKLQNIKGLAKGAKDAVKKTTFGKIFDTLFAPIGAVGAIISGFVGSFIKTSQSRFCTIVQKGLDCFFVV